jgi:hypothetical protein
MAFNGHTFAEGTLVIVTAMLFGLWTIVLLYRTLRLWKFSEKLSMFVTFAVYASSYAIWYVFLSPSFTHTYELFCVTVAMWAMTKYIQSNKLRNLIYVGLAIGMAFLIRPIFAIFGVFFGLYLLWKRDWKGILTMILSGVPFALLWMLYNAVSYGSAFASGYSVVRGENFDFSHFNGLNLLFAFERGWFIYSPIFLLAVIGLIVAWRKRKALVAICLAGIFSMVVIYGFWPAWWGGGSFGQRFMIVVLPFTTLGLAYLIANAKGKLWKFTWRQIIVAISILCVSWSLMLTLMYRFTPVAELRPKTDVVGKMDSGNRYTPKDIINFQLGLLKQSTGIKDYIQNVYQNGSGGVSIIVVLAGGSNAVLRMDERTAGELTFHLIYPPIGHPKLPELGTGYLVTADNKVYQLDFDLARQSYDYVLKCSDTCVSDDPMVIVKPAAAHPTLLSRESYVALQPERYNFSLYFLRPDKMQIKGNPINLPDGQFDYIIP